MHMRKGNGGRSGLFSPAVLLAAVFVWLGSASPRAASGDISGVVNGPDGPEAGVWVIAETDELETLLIKIVVTDDDGRFLIPELPDATFDVWVRGYGLKDSTPVESAPGAELSLSAAAATPAEAAEIYPASYWSSLLEAPPPSAFPGTGPSGNGIGRGMTSQEAWVDQMKQGCQLCHQIGSKITREITHIRDRFDSTVDAWDHRVMFGQVGGWMNRILAGMGRQRAIAMYADWTDRIAGGELPPPPPRPQGVERNLVITMWDWGHGYSFVHDEVVSDKRDPRVNANGPLYGVSMSDDHLVIGDPVSHRSTSLQVPVRDPATTTWEPFVQDNFEPSPFWGEQPIMNAPANLHNPMMDGKGRVWMTSRVRPIPNDAWCQEGSGHPSASYFPLARSSRQASYFDPATQKFVLVDTCYETHHLQFAEDADDTLWFSGDTQVIGWLSTGMLDRTGDERVSQGWCPTVLDTNGDGRITRPWNEPGAGAEGDSSRDTRINGFAYGIIPHPVDGSIWVARTGAVPGRLVRRELGDNPPETCKAEVYEPPYGTDSVPREQWGYAPRGIDVTRDGIIWTALSGSGHLASFDRSKCAVTSGPTATGQQCPEGWTLYPTPGPQMKGVDFAGSADFHYYNWVDQFDTLGLGRDVPIANGTSSDSLLALLPATGEWVIMRVPYPLGFYTRGLDGRVDDPTTGWKGRGTYADFGTIANWHLEGGKNTNSKIVKFQMRPHPLAN